MLRECLIEKTDGTGLHFQAQSQGSIEDVSIIGSSGPGIEIEGGASPTLRKVRVVGGKSAGILVQPLGGGSAEKCEARDNAGGDWEVAAEARLKRVDGS